MNTETATICLDRRRTKRDWHVFAIAFVLATASPGCRAANPAFSDSLGTLSAVNGSPQGLYARFFGNTTILISDSTTSILIDGFFSRPSLLELLGSSLKIQPNEARIEAALDKGKVGRIDALLVAHAHFDHAMDVSYVASRHGVTKLYGSDSVQNIALGANFPKERITVIRENTSSPIARFNVRFFVTPHSQPESFQGHITAKLDTPASLLEYRTGLNLTFLLEHAGGNVLIVPSAHYPLKIGLVNADVVFLSIGNLAKNSDEYISNYWHEAVTATKARLVIPVHWDNFTRPLDKPLTPFPRIFGDMNPLIRLLQRLAADSGSVALCLMPVFAPVSLQFPADERIVCW